MSTGIEEICGVCGSVREHSYSKCQNCGAPDYFEQSKLKILLEKEAEIERSSGFSTDFRCGQSASVVGENAIRCPKCGEYFGELGPVKTFRSQLRELTEAYNRSEIRKSIPGEKPRVNFAPLLDFVASIYAIYLVPLLTVLSAYLIFGDKSSSSLGLIVGLIPLLNWLLVLPAVFDPIGLPVFIFWLVLTIPILKLRG